MDSYVWWRFWNRLSFWFHHFFPDGSFPQFYWSQQVSLRAKCFWFLQLFWSAQSKSKITHCLKDLSDSLAKVTTEHWEISFKCEYRRKHDLERKNSFQRILAWASDWLGEFRSLGEKRQQAGENGVSKSKYPYLIRYHFVTLRRQKFEQMSLSYFPCQWKESLDFFPPKAWGFVQIARFWLPVNIILQQFFNAAFELSNKELTELDSQFCLLF